MTWGPPRGHQTVVTLQIRYLICYDINMTLPKVFIQQNTEQQPTQGAWPHVNATRWTEEKGPQVNQGNTLNSDVGNLQGDKTHRRYRVPRYRILTHVSGVRPTQSPDPAPGVTWPLVRTPLSAGWAPQEWVSVTSWDGRKKCRVGLLSPHLPQRSLHLFPLVVCILTVFTGVMIMLDTLPWFWQAWSFLTPLRCWENTPDAGLEEEGQVCSLLSRDSWLEGDHSNNLTCCPLAFCLTQVPCNQFSKSTCSLLAMLALVN